MVLPAAASGQQLRITVASDRLSAYAEWPETAARPTWDVLCQALIRSEVVFGCIPPSEWEQAPARAPVVVARGRAPEPPRDDTALLSDERRTQDWLDMDGKPGAASVLSGQVAAVRLPGRQGAAGLTVRGHWLPTSEPHTLRVLGLRGVTQGATPDILLAAESGRLGVLASGGTVFVEVVPVLARPGSALEPGAAIRHRGDVVVQGDLDKGQSIIAEGNVHVLGRVAGCKITAGGSVVVAGGVINAEIQAGLLPGECARLAPTLARLAEVFGQMTGIVESLTQLPAFRREDLRGGLGPLLRVLVEQKFSGLAALVESVRHILARPVVRQYPLFVDLERTLLHAWQSGQFLGIRSLEDLRAVQQALTHTAEVAAQRSGAGGHVRLEHADHTRVDAGGSVQVVGSGLYRCHISAQGPIAVAGKVIGDHLRSAVGIAAAVVRHHGGAPTVLSVPASGYIEVGEALPDTEVRVGDTVRMIQQPQSVSWRS